MLHCPCHEKLLRTSTRHRTLQLALEDKRATTAKQICKHAALPSQLNKAEWWRRKGDRWYFEVLKVQPIKVNVTLLPTPGFKNSQETSRRYSTAKALGLNLFDFNNVPLRINAMMLRNAFMRPSELVNQIVRHVTLQVGEEMIAHFLHA